MDNEEYIELIVKLLKKIKNNHLLERIYSYVNDCFVGRGD